jgi:hypothetical protein
VSHDFGARTTTVMAFRAAWSSLRAAHAAWNAMDEDDQERLLAEPDAPARRLVSSTLVLAEECARVQKEEDEEDEP